MKRTLASLLPHPLKSLLKRGSRELLSHPPIATLRGRLQLAPSLLSLLKAPPLRRFKRLHIVLGSACNNRCLMCYQEEFHRRITPRILTDTLLPLYPRVEEIILQGGEPTVLPESRTLMEIAGKANPRIRFSLFSNGLALDASWRETLLERGGFLNLSLNAASREVYSLVCRNNRWEKVLENLSLLVEERNRRGSPLKVRLSMVIIPENFREILPFLELGRSLGVDAVQFFFDFHLLPEKSALAALIERALLWRSSHSLPVEGLENLKALLEEKPAPLFPCSWPLDSLFVDVDGTLSFCCLFTKPLGNLHAASADRLLSLPKTERWRTEFRGGDRSKCGLPCRGKSD